MNQHHTFSHQDRQIVPGLHWFLHDDVWLKFFVWLFHYFTLWITTTVGISRGCLGVNLDSLKAVSLYSWKHWLEKKHLNSI